MLLPSKKNALEIAAQLQGSGLSRVHLDFVTSLSLRSAV
jgi:hypothetical protein